MKTLLSVSACAVFLTGCGVSNDSSAFLFDGTDTTFQDTGAAACPNIGSAISPQYPLRCGPQVQVIPR